jgi:hypothetical protein
LLVALIRLWGLPGAAWATLVRFAVETVVLFVLAIRDLHTSSAALLKLGTACVIAAASFVPAWLIESLAARIMYAAVVLPVLLGGMWLYLSTATERSAIRNIILRRSFTVAESAESAAGASS